MDNLIALGLFNFWYNMISNVILSKKSYQFPAFFLKKMKFILKLIWGMY